MRITRMEIDGEMFVVTKANEGSTYCSECSLNEKCSRKNEDVFPCNLIGEEEIFAHEADIRPNP